MVGSGERGSLSQPHIANSAAADISHTFKQSRLLLKGAFIVFHRAGQWLFLQPVPFGSASTRSNQNGVFFRK